VSRPSVAGFFPWRRVKVTYVNTVEASRGAIAVVEPDQRFRPICHACGAPGAIHSYTRKFIRDLSFADFTMLLQVEHRKIRCHHCRKVRVEGFEFVDASARVTHRLAAYAAQLCKAGLSVEAVAIDMWEPYINAVKRWCPQADVVFDLFHVVKAFNKDLLAHIWDYYYPGWAMKMLAEWCEVARQDGHPALVKFARKLERHQYGIISHCKHQIHTSKLEGVNNKIKVVKRIAYGFHDLEYFALKVKQALPGRFESN